MGSISVAANIVPGLYRDMMFGPQNDALSDSLRPLFKWLFAEPNPIGVNTMLMQLGMCQPVFRLPYTQLGAALREEGVTILKNIGLEHVPNGDKLRQMDDSEFIHTADY